MSTKFNPLAKKGFDKIGDTAGLVSDTAYGASWDNVTTVAPSKNAVYDKIQTLAGGHDAVTLDANVGAFLGLTGQELNLDTQVKNKVFASPATGADAVPTFRALVADDIPDLSGTYLTAETDPDFNAWLLATPPLYPGGWYDAVQNTIGLSGFDNDSGFITSFDDEKVKYDAGDPTAGYVADKIIAGTGISVAEGTGANENKLVVTSDITQYTDSDAIAAIQGDASWNATNWDTAYGWGNHASAGYYVGDGSAFDVAGAGASAVSGHELTYDHTLIATALQSETDPVFTAWDKSTGISITKSQISDLVLAQSEAGASNNFLTAYNSTTGAFSKARPTWANIDKTTSDIADITTKSHTSLSDIGTNTHAQIDTFIGTTVPNTYAPLVSPSFTTPTLGVASGTSLQLSGELKSSDTQFNFMQIGDHLTSAGDCMFIASWNEALTGTVKDYSLKGHDMTPVGFTDDSLRTNASLTNIVDVNGSTQYFTMADHDDFTLAGTNFTICGWVYVTPGSSVQTVLAKWNETTGSEAREYQFTVQGNESIRFQAYDESADVQAYRQSTRTMAVGWHHIAVTYDSALGSGATFATALRFYIDGVSAGLGTANNNASFVDMENLTTVPQVGANIKADGAAGNFFLGKFGQFFLTKVTLSATQIWQNFMKTRGYYGE